MCNTTKELDKINADQAGACNRNCRYAICSIIITCWGLIFQKEAIASNIIIDPTIPSVILILAVFYFMVDTISYYSVAQLARRLYSEVKSGDTKEVDAETTMEAKSHATFVLLKYKILYCCVLTVLLAYFIALTLL